MRIHLLLSLFFAPVLHSVDMTVQTINVSSTEKKIELSCTLEESEQILKQTMSISLGSPHAHIKQISITPAAESKYLPEFHDNKEVFNQDITITATVALDNDQPLSTKLHISFLLLPENKISELVIPITFNQTISNNHVDAETQTPHYNTHTTTKTKQSFTESLQNLVQTTDSNWIRLLFAFLLGLLLSLTPCIYPMIPITIGILHSQGQRSLLQNFVGSCCYAFGMSTMFALLGLLAAFAGASFGSLLSSPIFVIVLVLFIGYMSLTMIGVIDLTIPSFLQRSSNMNSKFGPYLSAYLFGLISGSVASPCVSPGLALLLTIVATMGNIFAGFLLLFCFGIGLSTPLIIIGTFSSSMSLLPRAGQWMVEVKKALGFVMLATCLYYLSNIVSTTVLGIICIIYLLFAALFYIIDAQKDFDTKTKTIKSLLGILLLAAGVLLALRTYDQKNHKTTDEVQQGVVWQTNYADTLLTAKNENKVILLDFWANHCTICKAIEKKLFHKDSVHHALKDRVLFVKVDCTTNNNDETNMLKNKFKVFAQPSIIIIDPNDETILKKWSSEPYSMTPDEFVKAVQNV